mmetsp:Transcript_10963/g.33634  ORF Transcript_10963/g.33634 Transcript_10963/m.33634 type:complete len:137 (+) Transcript_10963:2252-2662(+)
MRAKVPSVSLSKTLRASDKLEQYNNLQSSPGRFQSGSISNELTPYINAIVHQNLKLLPSPPRTRSAQNKLRIRHQCLCALEAKQICIRTLSEQRLDKGWPIGGIEANAIVIFATSKLFSPSQVEAFVFARKKETDE